jgi:hypothetical protein
MMLRGISKVGKHHRVGAKLKVLIDFSHWHPNGIHPDITVHNTAHTFTIPLEFAIRRGQIPFLDSFSTLIVHDH